MNKELEKRFREKIEKIVEGHHAIESGMYDGCPSRKWDFSDDKNPVMVTEDWSKCDCGLRETVDSILAFLDSELDKERERIKKWADKQYGSILQGGLTDDKNKGYKNALDDLLEELNKS